jgi:hypothetical protein
MAYSKKKSCTKRKSTKSAKTLKVGSVVSFYNVADKCKVNTKITGFIKRSNKKGREIKLAYGKDHGTKVFRIVSNTKSKKKSSKRH